MNETPDAPQNWKSRRMIRGRWRDPEAEDAAPKRVDKVYSVRMTEAELAELDAQIAPLGITRNRALRIAARRIGGFIEADAEMMDLLRVTVRQITGISTNINQLAKVANREGHADLPALRAELKAFGRELARVEGMMQRVLDVGKRRTDGLARLEKAAAEEAENLARPVEGAKA